MIKSHMYRAAAISVMKDEKLLDFQRLEIIEELLAKANLEKFCEEQAEKEAAR